MKSTAVAHSIQGLIKYHGLKDVGLRIPFHDSISVCADVLTTTTTVDAVDSLHADSVLINEEPASAVDLNRVKIVLNKLRELSGYGGFFKIVSENSLVDGKGLGFSASAFAALATAASKSLDFELDYVSLSELARLGAGSATRSLAGGFAIWYADKKGKSYAEQIEPPKHVNLASVIVPIPSETKTDEAHVEVLSSPLFEARLSHVSGMLKTMEEAIKAGDVSTIGELAEEDSLNLHASTMTGKAHMILWEPETIRIIKEVKKMRNEGVPAWFSIDTGPSVFVNTFTGLAPEIEDRLRKLGFGNAISSGVGGKPFLTDHHLF